jgi:orotate phosphoribosyltransferase
LPNGQNSVEYKKPQGAYLKKLQDSEVVYIAHFLKRGDEHAKGIELLRAQGITIKRLFTLLDYNLESTREIMECQKPYDSENTLSSEVKVQSILSLNEILRQELKSRKLKKTEYERVKEWQQEYQQRVLV